MKNLSPLFLLFLSLFAFNAKASSIELQSEYLLLKYQVLFQAGLKMESEIQKFTPEFTQNKKSMTATDVLWDAGWLRSASSTKKVEQTLSNLDLENFVPADSIRLWLLASFLNIKLKGGSEVLPKIYEAGLSGKLSKRSIYTLLNYQNILVKELGDQFYIDLSNHYNAELSLFAGVTGEFRPKTPAEIQDLVFNSPRTSSVDQKPKLFMFCRHDRKYPCRVIGKDSKGELIRNSDGSIWSQPTLAQSSRGLPFNVKNGYTPSGVYTLDSVMPEANRQRVFGQYRRLIVNFIPASENENDLINYLPKSAHTNNWWNESVVARDVGRDLLRIHGTNLKNKNPSSTYYPFIRTSGCIATREGEYSGTYYRDQRSLLDTLMLSSNLEPVYSNETKIKAILYLIELDQEPRAVDLKDLENLLNI